MLFLFTSFSIDEKITQSKRRKKETTVKQFHPLMSSRPSKLITLIQRWHIPVRTKSQRFYM